MRPPWTVILSALIIVGLTGIPPAEADVSGSAINGTFTAVSDGVWAKTNEKVDERPTVTAVWTITSMCSSAFDCTGQISSNQGWTAELRYLSGHWRARHTITAWQFCPDGSTAPGRQDYTFWPARANDYAADVLTGWDETVAPSGSCGINRSLTIRMPLRLTRIG